MKNICKTCVRWVDCKDKGYCVLEPLYTYTEKESCPDYVKGEPMKENEEGEIEIQEKTPNGY